MSPKIDRPQALGALGAVSLSGLLAACGSDDEETGSVTSSEGESSTVQTQTTTSEATAELFDESATCELTTELTEGPYYFYVDSIRSDSTEDREGTKLRLALRVRDADSCESIKNAIVDVWHCDAVRSYSGFESASQGGGGPGGGSGPTDATRPTCAALRRQTATGSWSSRRSTPAGTAAGPCTSTRKVHLDKTTLLTTQLFATREYNDKVYASAPYSEDTGRDTDNDTDSIYEDGVELTLTDDGDGVLGVMTFDVRRS